MSATIMGSDLIFELSVEEQQLLSGGWGDKCGKDYKDDYGKDDDGEEKYKCRIFKICTVKPKRYKKSCGC
ncbi:MAG: hypothetical protein KME21_28655 [Desmonostoc vinosum HA7617-LM4]|jgi:hypothetical protein|nr:hypothetical protein [Desmonostoc vinosum HA7617-LM4]